jgi:hypothetical protein
MGRIGRTYPRHEVGQAFEVHPAPERLIFLRRSPTQRLPGIAWLAAFACLFLLAWPSA